MLLLFSCSRLFSQRPQKGRTMRPVIHHDCRISGSAIPRTLPFAILSTALVALLYYIPGIDYWISVWRHPAVYSDLTFVIGFSLVFRTNIAHSRYMEARSKLQDMAAEWAKAVATMLAFEAVDVASRCDDVNDAAFRNQKGASEGVNGGSTATEPGEMWLGPGAHQYFAFRDELLHRASLLHALACMHLRMDDDLDNTVVHDVSQQDFPPGCFPPADEAKLSWKHYFVLLTNLEWHRANAAAAKMPILPCPGLGLTQAPRESVLLQSCLERHQGRGLAVEAAPNRVYAIYSSLTLLLARRCDPKRGWRTALPPTSAAAWKALGAGLEAFEQCRKLAETPFAFPWAQLMVLLLVIYSITLPLLMVGWLEAVWLALLLNFFTILAYWSLNEVARDLESPYLFPPNELPLFTLQLRFNERLVAADRGVLAEGGGTSGVV
jgi:predicted membrane chloride channel (bestrophin family)